MQWSNLFFPCGAPLSQNPSNFWSILAQMTLVFALNVPKNAIRLLNLTKFSNRGGNLVFLCLLLQQAKNGSTRGV